MVMAEKENNGQYKRKEMLKTYSHLFQLQWPFFLILLFLHYVFQLSSLKRLGLPDFFARVFSLFIYSYSFLHFVFHIFTEVGFKSYFG